MNARAAIAMQRAIEMARVVFVGLCMSNSFNGGSYLIVPPMFPRAAWKSIA